MILNGVNLHDNAVHEHDPIVFPKTVKGRIAHIDADIIAYQCTFEKKDKPKSFDEMKYNAEVFIQTIKKMAGADRIKLHITAHDGDKGGRYKTAVLKEYQANRQSRTNTPAMLYPMRNWMVSDLKAINHKNCEADDGMAAAQYSCISRGRENLSVICTIDKDLCMVPGLHLDWRNGTVVKRNAFGKIWFEEKVSKAGVKTKHLKGYGTKWFWAQMLMGDTADNISGVPKIWNGTKFVTCGGVGAYKLLNTCRTNKQARDVVASAYNTCFMDNLIQGTYRHWKTNECISVKQAFYSEAKLLWMRRTRSDPDDVLKWMRRLK